MCLIFLHSDPECKICDYKLVIAANRDEYFSRPSKQAGFLPENENILCGVDMEDNARGTWLGVTKTGKFGFLTNYLTPNSAEKLQESKKSRGLIVKNYLFSDSSPTKYINEVLLRENYRPFCFIGGQLLNFGSEITMSYFSNFDNASPYSLDNGSHILACSTLGTPWRKVNYGSQIFESLLKSANNDCNKFSFSQLLIDKLLSDKVCLYPDNLITEQCKSKLSDEILRCYCSVMVSGLPSYGTRAQTVVLVDRNNHLFFTEKSLDFIETNPVWKTCSYNFPIIL